jgi:hypothetical protein
MYDNLLMEVRLRLENSSIRGKCFDLKHLETTICHGVYENPKFKLNQCYDPTDIVMFIAGICVSVSTVRLKVSNLFRSGDYSAGRVVLPCRAASLRLVRILRLHQNHAGMADR